jgi:hypothetical protein
VGGELRPIEGVGQTPFWALTVPGVDALGAWQHFCEQANATGFWPVIIGEFGGAEFGGSDAALEGLIEDAQAARDKGQTPADILDLADTCPFDEWARRQRDPKYRESEDLRTATFFDSVGAPRLAELHRESAERWRRSTPWTFDPSDYIIPPKENRAPPQHQLHCVSCYDPGKRETVIADSVTMLFVPTSFSWQVPAFLFYTTKDLERPPQVHVAALKWLSERFGADLVGIEGRILEVIPRTRPTMAVDALHAAALIREYSDCPVTSENEMASTDELAVYLMESEFWTFCWP